MAIFEAEHLTFSYMIEGAHFPVLRDVNLNVQAGEVVAIQGPSGSGKSTLLYILGGLLAPDQGRVLFEGVNLYSRSKDALALLRNQTLGFVFQQFHLLPKSSVLDNILLPARYPCEVAKVGAEDREKAIGLAVKLGLGEHLERRPNQLSGGQQQRVAIARALMRDARLILADEPTGNLDTATAAQIMDLLKELARQGKAVVIITHDSEIAAQCERVYHIRDGAVVKHERNSGVETEERGGVGEVGSRLRWSFFSEYLRIARLVAPLAWANLRTHKLRSALTMMGITIGISSVLAMVTLGQFTKTKILQSYEDLGVNKLMFRGFRNWMLKATDSVPVLFRWFDYDRDLSPLKRIFPQIKLWSPILDAWNNEVSFGGRTTSRVMVYGVSPDYLAITNREVVLGRGFSPYHIENRADVCLIGWEVAQQLFSNVAPLGQSVHISRNDNAFVCRVIGILKSQSSNSEWIKPNLQIIIPFTFFPFVYGGGDAQINESVFQIDAGADMEKTSQSIKAFFEQKYGKSGRFSADSDSVLIAQMKKFLNLFSILLGAIAIISLIVGGIGITNMMLVSVNERFKEIGIRKAVGATDLSIRFQFLLEAMILCCVAGVLGLVMGFSVYELLIYGASKFVTKLQFEWVVDWGALIISVVSTLVVGLASGLMPALKAERLQVIEALRTE